MPRSAKRFDLSKAKQPQNPTDIMAAILNITPGTTVVYYVRKTGGSTIRNRPLYVDKIFAAARKKQRAGKAICVQYVDSNAVYYLLMGISPETFLAIKKINTVLSTIS